LKWGEVLEESFALCVKRSMTRVAVSWCALALVFRDGRGMAVLSAEDRI